MGVNKKIILWIAAIAILPPVAGCYRSQGPDGAGWPFDNPSNRKFTPATTEGPTAVESAIALSDKYAKLSEEASTLRQQKQNLDIENQRLKDEMQSCRSQLEKAQKEIGETNDLMAEMRLELNNWKQDVLGYRDEMRDAEKAQLEALLKILKLMGAEINQPGNPDKAGQTQTPEEQK
jgi:peptidoglycan hydrolase CwlO-like protein